MGFYLVWMLRELCGQYLRCLLKTKHFGELLPRESTFSESVCATWTSVLYLSLFCPEDSEVAGIRE